jgi:2-polyprenyl-6-methoxyphenol hydroxylase-like FAD-dependent oxidoreductase
MNVGIHDAHCLSSKLVGVLGGAPAALLDTYEEERAPVARQILSNTMARDRDDAGSTAAAQTKADAVSRRGRRSSRD